MHCTGLPCMLQERQKNNFNLSGKKKKLPCHSLHNKRSLSYPMTSELLCTEGEPSASTGRTHNTYLEGRAFVSLTKRPSSSFPPSEADDYHPFSTREEQFHLSQHRANTAQDPPRPSLYTSFLISVKGRERERPRGSGVLMMAKM